MTAAVPIPVCRSIGFSGHRILDPEHLIGDAIRHILRSLRHAAASDPVCISSIAIGADTLFVDEVLQQGLPWVAVLPRDEADFQKDYQPAEWVKVRGLLNRAQSVQVIAHADDREHGYLECGKRIVDQSDVLLTVWDGKAARGKGGTGDVVAYAKNLRKPILWVHSRTHVLQRVN